MSLKDDLQGEVRKIVRSAWQCRDGKVVPDPEDLLLGNDAIDLDATVLYADMNGSTSLVDSHSPTFAAEVYKSYLACSARIIKNFGGAVTAYDGDRIMAVFIEGAKNTNAVKAALKINWAVSNIVNAQIADMYGTGFYTMSHAVGIDTSRLMASRIGVRNDNDLVWVGRAANHAAKLTSISDAFPLYITGDVFDVMLDESKYGGNPRELMWQKRFWTAMNNRVIYRSNWTWGL
jgi:class 3 adenylate cyclase